VSGQIGTKTDINERTKLLAINDYNYTNNYGLTNKDALSDGDEKGRGENVSGQIGTKTDINERTKLLAINDYNHTNNYSSVNPDALSNGDDKGKGELNGNIGSKTDINERNTLLTINDYNYTNNYGSGNPDALSDGDEKGRGENSGYPLIGTKTDIFGNTIGPGRLGLQAMNTYGDNFKYDVNNPNAVSDGDEKGRGENVSGQIGTKTDIFGNSIAPGRVGLKAMNIYSDFFQYNVNNPNAVSDGDEKGRGENASGQIGTKTDIFGNTIGPGRLGLQAINTYGNSFQYSSTNPNALSDGDEKGKGELSGSIGSKTDIYGNSVGDPGRVGLIAINTYNNLFQYNTTNPNALSDGDEKGRGENSGYPLIGTKTDIFGNSVGPGRINLLVKNKYSTIKAYPDF
jgi:hypothetical protein